MGVTAPGSDGRDEPDGSPRRLAPTWLHGDRPADGEVLDHVLVGTPATVVDGDLVLGGDDLEDGTARLAGALLDLGADHGQTVAWQSGNRWETGLLYRACWRAGLVAAPIHHLATPTERDALLGRLRPALVVAPDDVRRLVDESRTVMAPGAAAPDDLAVVLHTSGSSGEPKGVLHTQAGLAYKARLMAEIHQVGPADTILMPAPLAHISGLQNGVTLPGAAGMTTVLMARWDPEAALGLIEEHHVTFMIGPPTFFVSLRAAPGFSPERVASIRLISCGGAGVTPAFVAETADLFGATVKRTYGSTEAPTVTTSHAGDDPARAGATDGRPTGSVRLRVGEGGELLVRGPELFVGYTDAGRTGEAVVDIPGEGQWFRTGDIGAIADDGWLTIVGRIKDVIIRGGENISASEVESVLEAHPAVRQAVAVGQPDERLGERVCAYVVCSPGATFDLDTCRAWFTDQGLARFKTPERIEVLDELPALPAGKPDRAQLRRQAATG